MILDTKNMLLDGVKLTTTEYRFIAALVSNKLILYGDLFNFIYYTMASKKIVRRNLSNLRTRIKSKIKIDLESRNDFGYILKNIVEVI